MKKSKDTETPQSKQQKAAKALKEQRKRQDLLIKQHEEEQKFINEKTRTNVFLKKINKKQSKVSLIINSIVVLLVVAFLVISVFATEIFGNTNFAVELKRNVGDVINIFKYFKLNYPKILKAVTYIFVIIVISFLLRRITSFIFKKSQRGKTISRLVESFIKYMSAIIIIWITLSVFGVDAKTLVASAGILALIIGLGAQSLISDVISGLFMVFEGVYKIGDIVVIHGFRGNIKEIGLRTTSVIDWQGNIKVINNSDIRSLVNMSEELSVAVCEVGIEYQESIERVEKIVRENLEQISKSIPNIIDGIFYKGISKLGSSSVNMLFFAECTEDNRFQVERDINREIKLLFDKNKINIPFPQIVINKPKQSK